MTTALQFVNHDEWVELTLGRLSLEEQLAQLLIPVCLNDKIADHLVSLMPAIPFGGVFVFHDPAAVCRGRLEQLQAAARLPLVVASDLECGAGHIIEEAVAFPEPLALAAADDEGLAYTVGKAAAMQGREVGIHWTFAPVVDVNLNPDNPIANTRSLGDDPARVARLAVAVTRGMQDHGLAACAKHFPGDGVDDLDQHVVTSINTLPLDRWHEVFGHTFGEVFRAGVLTTMIGHIALPARDGERNRLGAFRPATVSPALVTDFLRKELGFEGLVVTDDMNMGGVAGYMNRRDRTLACIAAGCDMLLFPRLPDDYETLLAALRDGRLPEERVRDAARRVLAFKARLGLHTGACFGAPPAVEEVAAFESASRTIARRAVHCVRDADDILPLKRLQPGARVLTVTLTLEDEDLTVVDDELRARGFDVDHLFKPVDLAFDETTSNYDAVFVNFLFYANYGTQTVRSVGPQNRIFMKGFFMEHPCVVFTSFASPYHLRAFSTLPNYINVHSSKPDSQRAAVAAWFGELDMIAAGPVANLERDVPLS